MAVSAVLAEAPVGSRAIQPAGLDAGPVVAHRDRHGVARGLGEHPGVRLRSDVGEDVVEAGTHRGDGLGRDALVHQHRAAGGGDLDAEVSADTIIEGLRLYAATSDGLVPWRERPEAFRKGVVARIPPFKTSSAA